MPANIYKASSFSQFIFTVALRMGLIPLLIYLFAKYNENPVVITVIIVICVLLFLFASYEEITVDHDNITQKDISLGNWLLRYKGTQYKLCEIKQASIPAVEKPTAQEIGIAVILMFLLPLPRNYGQNNRYHPVNLQFKDGRHVQLSTSLSDSKRREVVALINANK